MKLETAFSARIQYRVDAGRADTEILPFGGLICARGDGIQAIFLYVMKEIPDEYRPKLDWVSQQLLADPVTFFDTEIKAASDVEGADVLEVLADKFAWNIEVTPAACMELTPELIKAFEDVRLAEAPSAPAKKTARASKRSRTKVSDVNSVKAAARAFVFVPGAEEIDTDQLDERMATITPAAYVVASRSARHLEHA